MTRTIPLLAWLWPGPTVVDTTFTLAPGATIALRPGRRARVCADGQAWITQSGDARDHLPAAGEAVALRSRGLVVVQNLGATTLHVRCRDLRRRV